MTNVNNFSFFLFRAKREPWVSYARSKPNLTSARENNTSVLQNARYTERKLNRYHNLECLYSDSLIKST